MQNKAKHKYITKPIRLMRGNVLMLGLVSFFTDMSTEMIYPLLPVFLTGLVPLGTVAVYIGLMDGVAESLANLLKIISGHFSDRIRKRKLLAIIGYGISTASRPFMALAFAGWHTLAIRFVDRVGKGVRTSPRDALISDSVEPSARGLAFSFHRAMDHAGAVLGPVCAILFLYACLGQAFWQDRTVVATPDQMRILRWLFAATLIPGLCAMAVLVLKVREIAPKNNRPETCPTAPAHSSPMRLPKKFHLFLGIVTLFTLGNSSDLFLIFFAKTEFGLGLLQIVGMWIILHLSKIAFSIPGGSLSDRFGRRVMIVGGWSIYLFVYIAMIFVETQWFFWLLIIIYGAYYGMTEGAERALVADYVPSNCRGRAYGLYHGAVGLATLPASVLFGVLWAKFGPRLSFTIAASFAGIATILLVALPASRKTMTLYKPSGQ